MVRPAPTPANRHGCPGRTPAAVVQVCRSGTTRAVKRSVHRGGPPRWETPPWWFRRRGPEAGHGRCRRRARQRWFRAAAAGTLVNSKCAVRRWRRAFSMSCGIGGNGSRQRASELGSNLSGVGALVVQVEGEGSQPDRIESALDDGECCPLLGDEENPQARQDALGHHVGDRLRFAGARRALQDEGPTLPSPQHRSLLGGVSWGSGFRGSRARPHSTCRTHRPPPPGRGTSRSASRRDGGPMGARGRSRRVG